MKLKFESGRSMVEMLGVLAVIGVLSVGGIMGYSYGVDKYRANETVNGLMLMATDIIASTKNRAIDEASWVTNNPTEYDVSFVDDIANERYGIEIRGVPSRVCKMIGDALKDVAEVYVGGVDSDSSENSDPCDASEENTMEFYFGEMTCDPACGEGEICVWGECLAKGEVVYSYDACSTNDDCASGGECYGCQYGYCSSSILDGQSCQNGDGECQVGNSTGTCQAGQCLLNEEDCSSNSDCTGKNQYCADSNESCEQAHPTKCAKNLLVPREITVDGDIQYVYVSKMPISWWNAQSMCEAKGLSMLSISDLIKDWDGGNGYYTKTALADAINIDVWNGGYSYIWTKNLADRNNSCYAYYVFLPNGAIGDYPRHQAYGGFFAVCK